MLSGSAFSPGHVTGFFEIYDEAKDVRQKGSRGAGICLSMGVRTEVKVLKGKKQEIEILLNGRAETAPVTRHVVKRMVGDKKLKIQVESSVGLPSGQGFGMSGAGALSTALALSQALDLKLSENEMTCLAHEAEIACGCGLGDVMPQSRGGVVIRRKEGCHPYGLLESVDVRSADIVLCIVGESVSTKEIITDPIHKKRINKHGARCLSELLKHPDMHNMFKQSLQFARGTKFLTSAARKAIDAAGEFGYASMSMLGNSIFAMGEAKPLARALQKYGNVYICTIEKQGVRTVGGS
ncbi:MAG: pantothenate kinase [Thermoplasmata archaeon]|nr:MAG: pantothenate kinase [Thermoplasmata archaeon]